MVGGSSPSGRAIPICRGSYILRRPKTGETSPPQKGAGFRGAPRRAWRGPCEFSRIEGLLKGLDERKPLIRHGLLTMVDVAQLVEPRVVIPAVVGSSPIVHPTSR